MKKNIFIALSLFLLFACEGKHKTDRTPTVYEDSGVYSSQSSNMEEVDLLTGQTDYRGSDDSVGSELLDASQGSLNALPDWSPVFFEFDKAQLTLQAREKLNRYAVQLKNNRNWRILIEGHCDVRGTEAYNQALGEKRAEAVRRFLLDLGVNSNQMNTISYGELKPLIPEETEDAWTMNRRAEFRIQK
ncbi:MAG: peptidoglycan-associated lipoprotein [Acidobacteria bacterium]|nr:MAG: peptidoglycan-associated lipoprotein [Acidobacteriota bacterium]